MILIMKKRLSKITHHSPKQYSPLVQSYTVLNCCVAAHIVECSVGAAKRHACTLWTVMTRRTYVLVWNSTSIAAVVSR